MDSKNQEDELIYACTDPDPRVRAKAIRQLEHMCMRSRSALSMDSYLTIRDLCSNSSVNVRLSALRILEKLAQKYPEFFVKNQRGYELRVHDDAFSIMCHAINDLDTVVRTEAATLLRRFKLVSEHFLHQTLDKKLLAPMKRQKDGTTMSAMSTSWTTGKKFGEAAPDMLDDDDETLAILPTNTCGAFITALEDEFMAVRLPAVCSLCSLAVTRPDFAFAAIDHVSDMFNDEMHEVRLESIRALTPLLTYVKLNEAQLDSILSVLNDATPDTRIALHVLLAKANLADSACIRQVLKQLMISMQRYPRDKDSIYKCLSEIGRRHSFLIHALVPELFKLHPLFEPQEQDLNDEYYLAHLILAMNAAAVQTPIRPLIPKFAMKHYRFMRLAMPHLMPPFKDDPNPEFAVNQTTREQDADKQLNFIYQQIIDSYSMSAEKDRVPHLKMILKDLTISEGAVGKTMSVPIRFLRNLCELLIAYDMCISHKYSNETATLNVIEESLQLITQIRHLFNDINLRILQFLAECEFHLKLEYLFLKLEIEENITDAVMLEEIQQEIKAAQRRFAVLNAGCTEPTKQLIMWVDEFVQSHVDRAFRLELSTKDKKQVADAVSFLSAEAHCALRKLGECRLGVPSKLPQLRNCTLSGVRIMDLCDSLGQPINYTGTGHDSVHRFVAGLPTALRLHAQLYNISGKKLRNFRVEIVYPNNLHDYQTPEADQLIPMGPHTYRLDMTLILTADHWAEPSDVRIRCGVLVDQEEDEEREENMEVDGKDLSQFKFEPPKFVPFINVDLMSRPNNIQLRIHPMIKC